MYYMMLNNQEKLRSQIWRKKTLNIFLTNPSIIFDKYNYQQLKEIQFEQNSTRGQSEWLTDEARQWSDLGPIKMECGKYIFVKVNHRHQLCASNFATLQLWRRRSLSGNCRRQSRRRRKFNRAALPFCSAPERISDLKISISPNSKMYL